MNSFPNINCNDDFERLFLLEVLVNNVHYSFSSLKLDKSVLAGLGQTCVRIKFLNSPVMEICEEDFCASAAQFDNADIVFKSGKSCLFSLRNQTEVSSECLNVCVQVVRKYLEGGRDSFFPIGAFKINLTSSFTNIFNATGDAAPVCKSLKNTYTLRNKKNEVVGNISLFIRLSCFGKLIVTQFQLGAEESDSFMFKGDSKVGDSFMDKPCPPSVGRMPPCRPVEGYTPRTQGFPPESIGKGTDPRGVPCPDPCYVGDMRYPGHTIPPQSMYSPMGYGGNFGGFQYGRYTPGGLGTSPQLLGGFGEPIGVPVGRPLGLPADIGLPCGVPGGLSTSLPPQGMPPVIPGARGVTVGVGRSVGLTKYSTETGDKSVQTLTRPAPLPDCKARQPLQKMKLKQNIAEYPFCQRITIGDPSDTSLVVTDQPKLNLCDCDYPVPPGLLPQPPVAKEKKKRCCPLELTPGDYCMRSDCPCGLLQPPWMTMQPNEVDKKPMEDKFQMTPGSVGFKGKQVIFQMAGDKSGLTEVDKKMIETTQYKVGYSDNGKDGHRNIIQVIPDPGDPGSVLPPDSENDIFILKVGRKNNANKRAKMEIELKSPKIKDTKVQMIDADSQWLASDIPPAEIGEALKRRFKLGGKGKKRKGGKGGKGAKGKKPGKGAKGEKSGKGKKRKNK